MKRSRVSVRTSLLLACGLLILSPPAKAESVTDWCRSAAEGFREHKLREERGGDADRRSIVAVDCADESEDERIDLQCRALAHALAAALEGAGRDIVAPATDFGEVATWDHVACDDRTADRLGWDVIELRAPESKHLRKTRFQAIERESGLVLYDGIVRVDRHATEQADRWYPPFSVTADELNERRVASYLAQQLVCALKEQPEKHLLRLEISDRNVSPQEAVWLSRVGTRVTEQLNRVVGSSFHSTDPQVLELSLYGEPDAVRTVVPRISEYPGGPVIVDGLLLSLSCSVRMDETLEETATPIPVERTAEDLRTRIVRIANALAVSGEAWNECLDIFGRPAGELQAFERLLLEYDPRRNDRSALDLWRAWYEFSHPGSPANRYTREVADRLRARVGSR